MHIIRQWREKFNVKLTELARFACIAQPSLSHIEIGTNGISGDTALVISQLTGIPVYELRPDLKVSNERKKAFKHFLEHARNRKNWSKEA